MNERILELAIEARKYAESKPDIYQVAYDKKFAELIVAECKENFAKVWYEQGMDIRGADIIKFLDRFDEYVGVEE